MGFSNTLAETYKFMILLTTLAVLVPYLFSTASYAIIELKRSQVFTGKVVFRIIIALLAFAYSMWAIIGCGQEIVFLGFVLILLGTPMYVWMKRKA